MWVDALEHDLYPELGYEQFSCYQNAIKLTEVQTMSKMQWMGWETER